MEKVLKDIAKSLRNIEDSLRKIEKGTRNPRVHINVGDCKDEKTVENLLQLLNSIKQQE